MSEPGWVADALVIFGITGEPGPKDDLSALYRLERRGLLTCPVVGTGSRALTTHEPGAGAGSCQWRRASTVVT